MSQKGLRPGIPIVTPKHLQIGHETRRRAASQVMRSSKPIPGYTGHLRGHAAENVFASTFGEALVVGETARNRRDAGCLPGDDLLTNTELRSRHVDGGSLNTTMGSKLGHEPMAKAVSTFHNPRGHGLRAGAAIPGYAGFIPGKVAGNCFGKRVAMDNLHATDTRRINDEGAEWRTNWITACETNRKRLAHGAHAVGEHFQFPRDHPKRDASAPPKGWKLWEPKATHEWLRY
eukprot:TRINITY_DN10512_c0_g1_i2.p1 TRINITY_DN10512_c0_g1~~TRINITY_DN10512_c0_g1_i2.p1  ORF type:complete len:232 (+),score=18.20 TRINITY_DN10512_c0_g1_i2:89-784(+)